MRGSSAVSKVLSEAADIRAMPREQGPLLIIVATLVLAALGLEIANGRFWLSDFRVYYSAADALLHGQPMYGVPFGEDTGFFKYAPVVALVFVPFALLPYPLAACLHFLLIGVALGLALVRLEQLLMRHVFGVFAPRILLRGVLALLCIAVLLSRELHLGNINLWLVVLVVLATGHVPQEGNVAAGILFGAVWLTKPYLAFMIIPLVIGGRWSVLVNAAVTIGCALLLPMLFLGGPAWSHMHVAWLAAMSAHSGYLSSPDTFASLASTWSGDPRPSEHPLLIVLMIGAAYSLLCWWQQRNTVAIDRTLLFQIWWGFALVPHLVVTDQEHFLYSLPLIAFTLAALFRRPSVWASALFILAMVGYATRSSDLWGAEAEERLVRLGALGTGDLILLLTALLANRWSKATA